MKICMLPSVGVIYLRIDNKLLPVFFIADKRRERMYWEVGGNISKLAFRRLTSTIVDLPHR